MPCEEASANPTGTLEPGRPPKEARWQNPCIPTWTSLGCRLPPGKVYNIRADGRTRAANLEGVWTHPTVCACLQQKLLVASQVTCPQLDCCISLPPSVLLSPPPQPPWGERGHPSSPTQQMAPTVPGGGAGRQLSSGPFCHTAAPSWHMAAVWFNQAQGEPKAWALGFTGCKKCQERHSRQKEQQKCQGLVCSSGDKE